MDYRVLVLLVLEGAFALFLLWRSGCIVSARSLLRCCLLIALALFIRLTYFDRENTDYQWFLKVWVDFYRTHGGFSGLRESIGNYNIPYLYFLALFSYSSIRDLYLIKLLSVLFDIVLAWSGLRIIQKSGGSRFRAILCFFAILFLPTVLLNSSCWGQCDSIYVSFALLGLALALPEDDREGNPVLSMICIAVSFGFKLQAVFIMPAWVLLWVWRKYKWYWFLLFPLTYLVLILPAVLFGRPLLDAVMLYIDQADTVGSALNYNAPSLTALLRNPASPDAVSNLLIVCAFLATFVILLVGIFFRHRMNVKCFLSFAALTVLVIPFLLPHMHDRYFFAADVLTLILAVCTPPLAISAILTEFGSYLCYLAYFTGYYQRIGNSNIFLTNDKGALAVLLAILFIIFNIVLYFRGQKNSEKRS